jgi:phenylacetate-CoA ligase
MPLPRFHSAPATTAARFTAHFAAAHWRWRALDEAALQAFQEARAQAIVAYAVEHSPFYRRHWQGYDLTQWRTLPTVDKAAMMAHFGEFNTCGVAAESALAVALAAEQTRDFAPTVDGLTVGLSSGTSGHRGLFLVSPAEGAMWAGVILARALHTLRRGRTRVAFFLRSHSNLYRQVNGVLLELRYFDLMTPPAAAVSALNACQPHILVGPPSLLGLLAAAQTAGALRIAPDRLISVAEVLEPQDEAHIAAVFGAPVHQIYQCTEGLLAVSCPHGTLHIQEDLVALQCAPLLDASPATYGAAPESHRRVTPIVTDLWRCTQPIIRYRLNDVLELGAGPCSCGSSFRTIARIEGRRDDICYFVPCDATAADASVGWGGNGRRAFFPDTIRRMVLLAHAAIEDYLAVQERDGHLRIHLQTTPGASRQAVVTAVRAAVLAGVDGYACRPPQLEIEFDLPPLPPGRKRRRVQRVA